MDLHSVKVAIKAAISTNTAPGEIFPGKLVENGVAANPLSRSYLVIVSGR